ncbi:TetR/AcrR family transcriptional regulator [Bradyrhizobium sp. CNPSo 4010]|uniref:TetR/AcrR family transcriptional regulator n=1 Tax=Bradyrhizobium agreste TaxID=2751811 RepID=A0ABS0PKE7_9BRAD|nr:TetR/AcrR family transcriptional regulator [Bradyrhizobium agreste]MBH5397550.1 TetR/AcrR family transcriptional regulator [Bradyrhizobium agreste]
MRRSRGRVSAQYWIDVAARELCARGPDALTIDLLCRKTRKTKGSFYAHFDNYDAFLIALAADWRKRNTEAVIQTVDEKGTPNDRLATLNHLAVRLDAKLDHGMRMLAARNSLIADAVAEVDETRISYLADLYRAAAGYSRTEARDLATIEYAAFVGLPLLAPRRSTRELERLYKAFIRFTSRRL